MKRKIFFTGSIFSFYVPEIEKYAICKYFDFTHLSRFHGLLGQVFDFFSDTEDIDIRVLSECDYLFGPRSMHKWPDLRKDTSWKYIGMVSSPADTIVPDFKAAQVAIRLVHDESKIAPWYPIHNVSQRGTNCEYEAVRHLEHIVLTPASLGIPLRTGMEYCRNRGIDVENLFNISDLGTKLTYYQMINTPLYKDIPKEIRGKALV